MYHRLLVHVVWTTRDRAATIDLARAEYLHEHLPIIVRQERGRVLELGIVATHLHILVRLHPTTQLPRLLQRMKGGTAHGMNQCVHPGRKPLNWAKGYSATSISPRDLEPAAAYVRGQHIHHSAEAIAGWGYRPVASATPAEPRLSAASSVASLGHGARPRRSSLKRRLG